MHAIALRVQIRIEPAKRRYSAEESVRLDNLFGDPSRYADTLKPLQFAFANVMVPSFTNSVEVQIPVPCTYDLEIASTSYFHGLSEGEIPLLLLFSGTVFTKGASGFSVAQVPWSCETEYRLPVAEWRLMMNQFFPNSGWVRLSRETLDALGAFKNTRALPTWEHAISALLDEPPGNLRNESSLTRHDPFAGAKEVADTILYEGYVLYPYRASSAKNQTRWQFGVLMPPAYVVVDASERSSCRTQMVFEAKRGASLRVRVRFLHVAHRTGGGRPEWDETVEREFEFDVAVADLLAGPLERTFSYAGSTTLADGVTRVAATVDGAVVVTAVPLPGPYSGAGRLTVEVANRT